MNGLVGWSCIAGKADGIVVAWKHGSMRQYRRRKLDPRLYSSLQYGLRVSLPDGLSKELDSKSRIAIHCRVAYSGNEEAEYVPLVGHTEHIATSGPRPINIGPFHFQETSAEVGGSEFQLELRIAQEERENITVLSSPFFVLAAPSYASEMRLRRVENGVPDEDTSGQWWKQWKVGAMVVGFTAVLALSVHFWRKRSNRRIIKK